MNPGGWSGFGLGVTGGDAFRLSHGLGRREGLVEKSFCSEKGFVRTARTVGVGGEGEATKSAFDVLHGAGPLDTQFARPGGGGRGRVGVRKRRQRTFKHPQRLFERRLVARLGRSFEGSVQKVSELRHIPEERRARGGLERLDGVRLRRRRGCGAA